MMIVLSDAYSNQIAKLHIDGIPTGFISSLGINFVTALYEAIAEDENSFGFVAVEDDKVLGFVAFSTNLSKLYKYVALKKGLKFTFILARKMTSLKIFRKVWDNIFYPNKMKKMELPDAELLSIIIAEEGRGKGIARQLIDKSFEECRKRRIDKIKVLVSAENIPANNLYKKCGFEFHSEVDSHSIKSNVYVAKIN